jgi:hypothetical protein
MTIEFRCTNCDKLLRTPPGTEGKQAKCPDCGALMTIPSASAFTPPPREPDFRTGPSESQPQPPESRPREPELRPREPAFPPGPGATAARDSGNPFQSPSAESMQPEVSAARRGFQPTQIQFGPTFERAWQIYKENFGMLVSGTLVVTGVSIGLGIVLTLIMVAVVGVEGLQSDQPTPQYLLANFLQNVISNVVQTFLTLGLLRFTLKITRREPAAIGDIFGEGGLLLPAIGVNILLGLAVFLGFLLCILPGVWVALTLAFCWYMLLDQGTGVIDSLKYSARATHGNKLVLLGLWLVSVGLVVVIGIPTCLLGTIFVFPFVLVLFTVAYLSATGQFGAEVRAPAPYMTPPPSFE